jgi:AraC family transcriptional regulator
MQTAWAQEPPAPLTFCLNPVLLACSIDNIIRRVTGTLQWVQGVEYAEIDIPAEHPALHVQTAYTSRPAEWVELVPHLPVYDPLLKHMALVLQAEIEAESMADRLYAESLADALAIHFLKRYAACRPSARVLARGLAPYKLRRTTTYIQEHLDHQLSLIELAAVAQTSPKHFARLFKYATGKTFHQYVLSRRIDRAKQLLAETMLSLSEVSYQVGCTDQSHLTALFRKHVGMTPKAYRDATYRE